jgi:hypothetical protein
MNSKDQFSKKGKLLAIRKSMQEAQEAMPKKCLKNRNQML